MCDFSEEIMTKTEKWTAPLLMLFFVLSGAELELSVFTNLIIVAIGIIYILFRSAGKILGTLWSASLTKCDANVKKYLGITLLPQAGVALGMASIVRAELGEIGIMIGNIVLFGVLIYELVGPLMTKIALTKAGDIQPKASNMVVEDSSEDEE
jgi:Kef-type K+ transport system membrane component KefB